MSYTDDGAFQRPYPFTIDNRASPSELPRLLCTSCGKGCLYYVDIRKHPGFKGSPLEHVECDRCHEIFQLERK